MAKRSLFGGRDAVPGGSSGGFLPRRGQTSALVGEPVVWSTPTDGTTCVEKNEDGSVCGRKLGNSPRLCEEHLSLEHQRGNWRYNNLR